MIPSDSERGLPPNAHRLPPILYLGRSRLHRSRANLIQTLHMVHAFHSLGYATRLYLPPWPAGFDSLARLREVGVPDHLDLHRSALLHPRFRFHPFIAAHRRELGSSIDRGGMIFTRVPEASAALSRWGIPHHLEVHEVRLIEAAELMDRIVASHSRGSLRRLFPTTAADAARLVDAGADPARVHPMPNGVDLDTYCNLPAFDPARLDRPRIVYVGRVTIDRGLGIFQHIADTIECTITAVGDQDDVLTGSKVETVPFVPHREVPAWYGRCDLAVMPYQSGLAHAASISPIKLFEAMAAARPILASRLPTIEEVIEHERTGLLVDPEDPDAWVAAVRRLQDDRDLAATLAQNARAEAEKYSWTARARRIVTAAGIV